MIESMEGILLGLKDNKSDIKITDILDILICLLLFIAALYKGEFYKEDSLFISMVICMLGLVCLAVKIVHNLKSNKVVLKSKLVTIIDSFMIVMPVAYFLPVLLGKCASFESGIFETIRYINLTLIYFIVRSGNNKKIYINSLIIIGTMLAILGIDEITINTLGPLLNRIGINYLDVSNGRISSTIQYANITALIMLIASIFILKIVTDRINTLKEDKGFLKNLTFALSIFLLVLLQSAVILTTSRMNTFLVILSILIYSIYLLIIKEKRGALASVLLLLVSFVLVASIDTYLLKQQYFMIILTYILTLVIALIILCARTIVKKDNTKWNIRINKDIIVKNKKIIVLILIGIVILFILCMLIPKSLTLAANGKGYTLTRYIHEKFEEKTKVEFQIESDESSKYQIDIYAIAEDFSKQMIDEVSQADIKNSSYITTLNIPEGTIKLRMDTTIKEGTLKLNSMKLNDKNITLAYLLAPDTIIFRLRDTFSKDSNNILRYTYYKDALKLVKTSPLVGIGGEGFKSRYQEVQDEDYISSEAHSVPLQILVESGIVGLVTYLVICISTFCVIYKLFKMKKNNKEAVTYFVVLLVFLTTSLFDLVFSFGIMINIFGIIVGVIVGEYKKGYNQEREGNKDLYILDNKSTLSMIKIAVLSISFMVLIVTTVYSIRIYKASMLILPEKSKDNGYTLSESYAAIGILEQKIKLDKYNISYLSSLLKEYENHISLLNSIYIVTSDKEDRASLKEDMDKYTVRRKEFADHMIEYEYYNKYVLGQVARCYFEEYISYTKLFEKNFKNDEIAYTFYVGYAIKLTDRITEVSKVNSVARQSAINIFEEYIPDLKRQNKIIASDMLASAISDMENKLEVLKNK